MAGFRRINDGHKTVREANKLQILPENDKHPALILM